MQCLISVAKMNAMMLMEEFNGAASAYAKDCEQYQVEVGKV